MYHGALTNLNCANSATAHSENNSANRVSESELLGTIAESADASYHHFNGAAREVNFWAPPLTPPPRLNRIPRASTPTCWSAWLARPLRRWAMRRNIRRIERAIETLAVYMFTDQVEAEALKRQYKTSPTLAARRSADSLVLAGLNRDLVAAQLALAELDGQP